MTRTIGDKKMVPMRVWLRQQDHERIGAMARRLGISHAEFIRTELLSAVQRYENQPKED